MNRADVLRQKIAEMEDDIACAEADEEETGEAGIDIDTAMCELADLRDELRELTGADD